MDLEKLLDGKPLPEVKSAAGKKKPAAEKKKPPAARKLKPEEIPFCDEDNVNEWPVVKRAGDGVCKICGKAKQKYKLKEHYKLVHGLMCSSNAKLPYGSEPKDKFCDYWKVHLFHPKWDCRQQHKRFIGGTYVGVSNGDGDSEDEDKVTVAHSARPRINPALSVRRSSTYLETNLMDTRSEVVKELFADD